MLFSTFLNVSQPGTSLILNSRSCPRPWSLSPYVEHKHQNSKQWPKRPRSGSPLKVVSIYIASFRCKLHRPCRITHGQQRFCQVLWMYCQAIRWRRRALAPFLQISRATRASRLQSRLDYNRRTLVDHFEQFDHVLVTHPHAAVTRRRADFVLVFGAMNVDEAGARVRIVLI